MYKLVLLLLSFNAIAEQAYWQMDENSFTTDSSSLVQNADIKTDHFQLAEFNKQEFMRNILSESSSEKIISLPLPDGSFEYFSIQEISIMAPNLAAKYPEFKTYRGQSLESKKTLALSVTHKGLNAVIKSAKESVWIDPISRASNKIHMSYYRHNLENRHKSWNCDVKEHDHEPINREEFNEHTTEARGGGLPSNGLSLKTYRIAVAATAEYTSFHSQPNAANVKDGMAAIVIAMNRVNQIYEVEVGIRMILIDNNDQIVFTNTATDGYTNNNGFTMLGQNTTKLNQVIGSSNFDIGHVFSTGGGGIAGFGVVCGSRKAEGVTGLGSPVNDAFYVDYVAHEIGHQWRGSHIFNSVTQACGGGNRSASGAFEPGSGSTIMGYAGICGALNNLQNRSDPYFNSYSLNQIINFSRSNTVANCSVTLETTNEAPVVDAGEDYAIPHSTPFLLCADATDDDDSNLTFNWEQNDLGPAGNHNVVTGNAPAFRSFNAVTDNCRMFPRLTNVLNNSTSKGELLPDYARNMNLRATVRDNALEGGGVGTDDVRIQVTADGPFSLTSHDGTNNTIVTGVENAFTWDVANTNAAPVNCATVDIDFSVDGGQTFDNATTNIPNTGNGSAMVPESDSNQIRVRITCSDNIFFDINNTNLSSIDDLIFDNSFESD